MPAALPPTNAAMNPFPPTSSATTNVITASETKASFSNSGMVQPRAEARLSATPPATPAAAPISVP